MSRADYERLDNVPKHLPKQGVNSMHVNTWKSYEAQHRQMVLEVQNTEADIFNWCRSHLK